MTVDDDDERLQEDEDVFKQPMYQKRGIWPGFKVVVAVVFFIGIMTVVITGFTVCYEEHRDQGLSITTSLMTCA